MGGRAPRCKAPRWEACHAIGSSERHGLSQGFIGLTILAIGTDLPELLVSVSGSLQQLRGIESSGLIVGNAT